MENFQDDQLNNSGRSHQHQHHHHHHRSHQLLSPPKPYPFDFQGVDGYREPHFHPQMHPMNYSSHLYHPGFPSHCHFPNPNPSPVKEETLEDGSGSGEATQQLPSKSVCLLPHCRVPPIGYSQNGDGHVHGHGHMHHLAQEVHAVAPHHGYAVEMEQHGGHLGYDGSSSSSSASAVFSINPVSGLVPCMPPLSLPPSLEQNHHLSALAAVSGERRFYDSQMASTTTTVVQYADYRAREQEDERQHQHQQHCLGVGVKSGAPVSVSCSPAQTPTPVLEVQQVPSCVRTPCPSETGHGPGTPLSALNQLASVDETSLSTSNHEQQRRIFSTDQPTNRLSSQARADVTNAAAVLAVAAASGSRKRSGKRSNEDEGGGAGTGMGTPSGPCGPNERTGGAEVGDLEDSAIQSAARVVERGRYECALCNAVCVDRQGFADHLFGFHLGIARFFCRFCDKKFFYRPKVYEHIREAHSKNVAGKKKKGVVPFLYQIEPEARTTLLTFLKNRNDGRDGITSVEMHCLGSRGTSRRQRGGGGGKNPGGGKPKPKPPGPKAAFPCRFCNKEFTAQSYVDRHMKKGGCNRRRVAKRAATPNGPGMGPDGNNGTLLTASPSPTCSPSPTPTPSPSPVVSSEGAGNAAGAGARTGTGTGSGSGFRHPGLLQPRPNMATASSLPDGSRHHLAAASYFQHHYNNTNPNPNSNPNPNQQHAPPHGARDEPESYVLLEL